MLLKYQVYLKVPQLLLDLHHVYTQLVFVSTAPAPRPLSSLEVTIDRPFFYYIADKNNVPVFAGIIGDPTAKDEQ